MFRKIKGQEQVIGLLQSAIEQSRIAQAYLFHGGDGVGKFMTAL
ncbi:MAG: DNA polymerase III subunit delta', partial [Candidatus Cloacimonetes bacterium]|nr:DNA polymerase III subunit delta' [Candidatus Cloacimonadota bacterium]MDY0230140.1 DNA polymerase III subunit delta' [Candidatus Cloacimonadaceae bacterium]